MYDLLITQYPAWSCKRASMVRGHRTEWHTGFTRTSGLPGGTSAQCLRQADAISFEELRIMRFQLPAAVGIDPDKGRITGQVDKLDHCPLHR